MPSIDFIFFDMGNVLLKFSHQRLIDQVASLSGLDNGQVEEILFRPPHDLENRFETGLINAEEFHAQFCELAGVTVRQAELELAISDIFWLNTSIVPVVAQLRSRNFPIGILSNTCESHWNFGCERFALVGKLFDKRILSYEEKSMKPDLKIYQAAIELAGCEPERIFFADDKLENIEAARSIGMTAEIFESAGELAKQLQQLGIELNV
jgi:putative hydrolase of the HAD superfamily